MSVHVSALQQHHQTLIIHRFIIPSSSSVCRLSSVWTHVVLRQQLYLLSVCLWRWFSRSWLSPVRTMTDRLLLLRSVIRLQLILSPWWRSTRILNLTWSSACEHLTADVLITDRLVIRQMECHHVLLQGGGCIFPSQQAEWMLCDMFRPFHQVSCRVFRHQVRVWWRCCPPPPDRTVSSESSAPSCTCPRQSGAVRSLKKCKVTSFILASVLMTVICFQPNILLKGVKRRRSLHHQPELNTNFWMMIQWSSFSSCSCV